MLLLFCCIYTIYKYVTIPRNIYIYILILYKIASGKHYCISLTKAPLNGVMVKLNTSMIDINVPKSRKKMTRDK